MDPFSLAAKYSLEFAQIYPFRDGNGRMCRMILNAVVAVVAVVAVAPMGSITSKSGVFGTVGTSSWKRRKWLWAVISACRAVVLNEETERCPEPYVYR